jgi:hypothetical protein
MPFDTKAPVQHWGFLLLETVLKPLLEWKASGFEDRQGSFLSEYRVILAQK